MKRNTMKFSGKAISLALFFVVFLFFGNLAAADLPGCQDNGGCGTSSADAYNSSPFTAPTYAPSWTTVTTNGRVKGGQYLRFSVVEGEVYSWSTEGPEDEFFGSASSACSNDNTCYTNSDKVAAPNYYGLRCVGGYCLLLFDTELTLLKGESCDASSEFLAYSNSGGFSNQSQIEWKADFTGTVTLLVTNYEYSNGTFTGCSHTDSRVESEYGTMTNTTTTVKWQRAASEPCTTCGETTKYLKDQSSVSASKAPLWTTIQSREAVNLLDFLPSSYPGDGNSPNDLWIKPGSYVVFNVTENQIYRWSTCVADFQDTQLTLFKGDRGSEAGDGDSCGEVLAYGDDSKVSYTKKLTNPGTGGVYVQDEANGDILETYCPTGTRQTVLEWQANFTGKVTLLLNEYNCYQCYPQEIVQPGVTYNNWLNCFYEVTGQFKTDADSNFIMDNGWPVEAASSDTNKMPGTFVYPFPLDWQRYDCDTCTGSKVATIGDTGDTGVTDFESGSWLGFNEGNYAEFYLTRGSKYLFQTTDPDAVITIRRGAGCTGELVAQATGKITYFAESDYDNSTRKYKPDIISVFVSNADCRTGANTMKYSYYGGDSGNIKSRYNTSQIGTDIVVEDTETGLQFVDLGSWTTTWKEAMRLCSTKTVGGGNNEEDILACPPPICPQSPKYSDSNDQNSTYFCKYQSVAGNSCPAPSCDSDYTEFKKTGSNQNDPDLQDFFGKCYYSGSSCDTTVTSDNEVTQCEGSLPTSSCSSGYTKVSDFMISGTCKNKYCLKCPDGYTLTHTSTSHYVCRKNECRSDQECITIGGGCSYVATECPDGYEEDPSTGMCLDNYNREIINANPASSSYSANVDNNSYSIQTPGATDPCPNDPIETWYDNNLGKCQVEGCGTYTNFSNLGAQSASSTTGYNSYYLKDATQCYATEEEARAGSGTAVICCCESNIEYRGSRNGILRYDGKYKVMVLVGSAKRAYSCAIPDGGPCDDYPGAVYNPDYNQCAYCSDPAAPIPYERRTGLWGCRPDCEHYIDDGGNPKIEKCLSCNSDDETLIQDGSGNWKCVKCADGRTPAWVSGSFKCVKECDTSDGSHIIKNGYCYPASSADQCKDGWIKVGDKCRRWQLDSGGDEVYVQCGTYGGNIIDFKNNQTGRTCDPDKPNSYDCDCFKDRCEDITREQDAKVCPDPYEVKVCVRWNQNGTCRTYSTYHYPTETETMQYNLQGYGPVDVVKTCHYTDATGQACGEAMGGWILPNINQLYSIVDFDLYDAATTYPFSSNGYNRTESDVTCEPVADPSEDVPCTTNEECEEENEDWFCFRNKCKSSDPYGDNQCGGNNYLCIDNKCVRNNWYWSSTTVVRENTSDARYVWAVNMQDGRSYFAKKGCDGDECSEEVDLNARAHHVLCVKGSSLAGIFDADAPTLDQTFSGWVCDKEDANKILSVYFGIVDKDGKDVVNLKYSSESDYVKNIPGHDQKGVFYGLTDDSLITDNKSSEIYYNCGFDESVGKAHAFGLQWRTNHVTSGKEEIAAVIKGIQDIECSSARIQDESDAKEDCAYPPYFVTAYGVDGESSTATAVPISPENRPFVFTNRCGDDYKTDDGSYAEECESDEFAETCVYGNDECQLCAATNMNVNGTAVKACTKYNANPEKCMDGTLQSQYCVENDLGDFVVAEGHEGEGLPCDFYNFAAHNIESSTEECDCQGGTFYLYPDNGVFNCNTPLSQKVCPNYYVVPDGQTYDKNAEDAACYICDGCKKKRVLKPRCGDGKIHRPNCSGYTNCEVVATASEECDDGNTSDTDSCTNDCKVGTCGDGHIQPSLNEICDSGEKNGWYETNCIGTMACPGCASTTCGKPDGSGNATDPFGPRCGDGIVQNRSECSAKYSELGFSSVADCQTKLTGAEEVCDLGVDGQGKSLNGTPVPFSNFLATSAGSDCAEILNGVSYSVSAIHPKFLECVYKYKQFLADPANSGCASDCKSATAPFCGDGKVDKKAGEVCDDGLPVVGYNNGVYTLSSAYDDDGLNYNGKKLGSCRLDCMGKYECQNDIVETENCVDKTADGFCPKVGTEDGKKLYVRYGDETCDDGVLTGTYGYCDYGCKVKAYCGSGSDPNDLSGTLNCIRKDSNGKCLEKEECDFGEDADKPNTSIDLAYSKVEHGTCIVEDSSKCTRGVEYWKDDDGKDIICCKYGRFCGDGTVDNGATVGDNINWKDASKWQKVNGSEGGATVKYDARNLSLRFELTAATATMELNADIPIDLEMRYLLEFNMMSLEVGGETIDFQGGVNQYDASGTLLTTAGDCQNKSPYFFTEVLATANDWNRGKNVSPIEGESIDGSNTWYTGTKKVRIVFKMQGAAGTQFLVRALTFYDINHAQYSNSLVAVGGEMCDPGKENFVTSSNSYSYMTDCNSDCKWTNYCGDGKIQRNNCGTEGVDYFLLRSDQTSCVDGIAYADEVCDITNNSPDVYNGCEPGCQKRGPYCGDGKVDRKTCPTGSEEWCHSPSGDFKDETCDKGSLNKNDSLSGLVSKLSDYNACREDCKPARCGDGILDEVVLNDGTLEGTPAEECDCGTNSASYFEDTKNQYTMVNGEKKYLCMNEDGSALYNTVSAERAALCRPNCKISRCGDGIKDEGEECDDGNFNDHDSCTSQCKFNEVGDGIWAHSRSYLCEELKNLTEAQMKKMRDKKVVDCVDSGSTMTCAQLAEALKTDADIKMYFESNVLHCCYNQKLGGGADDKNCEYPDDDGHQYKPRDLAVRRCTQYALYPSGEHNTVENHRTADECSNLVDNVNNVDPAGQYSAIEQCELCVNATCGKSSNKPNQQELNCSTKYTTQTEINECIERNKYCSKLTGWNIIGKCGDGKVDKEAGEKCDNSTNDENFYDDLYGVRKPTPGEYDGKPTPWAGSYDSDHRWFNGHYCTGECVGSCTTKSPMCGGTVSNNCWMEGCTKALHGSSNYTEAQCGDGNVDKYAGEECDYGASANFDDWMQSYCGLNCKFNRQYSGGPTAKCGDGQVQRMTDEICDDGNEADDDYCVGDGSTDSNGYVKHCMIYYGSCGDGHITGPGYTFDSLWNDGTLNTQGGSAGPEDCDTRDERTKTLVAAGLNVDNLCATVNAKPCKRKGYCGDGQINPRFESCDLGGDNATETVTVNGKTCFAGCKSNPKGGFIKASNAELKGWACDPDHPMTHPESLVRIEIYDSLYESCKTSHPTDYATACADHYVGVKTIATTIDISVTEVNVIKECGGGSKHGWTYDPSKSDAAMNWTGKTGPYTVEAYATSLDGSPETEVFLGKKTFASAMKCGDNYISQCSSIEVVKLGETEPSSWEHNQTCCDEDEAYCPDDGVKIQGACADKGLENKKACIDEQCDNGNDNDDNKDCNSKCQLTYCGDNTVQTESSRAEECEGSQTKECGCDPNDNNNCFPPRLGEQGTISGTAECSSGTSDSACKWIKNSCQISSTCPPLSTAIKSSWDYGTSHYDPDKASTYISYKSETSYIRNWNGTDWGPRETEVTYTGTCSFKCNTNFLWKNGRCEPQNKTKSCGDCPQSAGKYAVWTGTTDKCNGIEGTAVTRNITQRVNLDGDGNVTYSPSDSDLAKEYNTEEDSAHPCRWSCDTANSVYMDNKCKPKAGSHPCSGKPNGTVWVKVTLDGDKIKYENVDGDMTVSQTLDTTSGSGTYGQYVPTTAQLVALDVNNAGVNSPANLKNDGQLKASDPVRCYYGCQGDQFYDPTTGKCESVNCGDSKIFNETCEGVDAGATCVIIAGADELCDDGGNEGTYWKGTTVQTKSHCDQYCGSYNKCKADHPSDYSTACEFIKANGYKGRIKNGSEYFCGDGKVQVQSSGNGCTGDHKLNCMPVSNYENMGVSDLATVSEACDPNDTASSDRTAMCNKALNANRADGSYYPKTGSTAPSCGGNCTFSNATTSTGCNYCGDRVKADSEACEPGESTSTICSRETGSYYGQNYGGPWDIESTSWPTWISASASSWGLNSSYHYSGSYSYCSTNTASASSSATLTLNVTSKTAGYVSFYIQGSSESNYDFLYIYMNGSQQESVSGTTFSSWTYRSYYVSAGNTTFQFTYTKDSSVDKDMDRYCVDYITTPQTTIPYTTRTSNPSNKTCNSNCTLSSGTCYSGWCGDGTTQSAGGEACDNGSSNSDSWSVSKHCNGNCTGWAPYCGDGVVSNGEACEPGYTKKEKTGTVCKDTWTTTDYYYDCYKCKSDCSGWTLTEAHCDCD